MSLTSLLSLVFWNLTAFLFCGYFLMDRPHRWILLLLLLGSQILVNMLVVAGMRRYRISGLTIICALALFGVAAKAISDEDPWEASVLIVPAALLRWSLKADHANPSRKLK